MLKFEKGIGFKHHHQSPAATINNKYESFNLKGNTSTPDNNNLKIHSNKN